MQLASLVGLIVCAIFAGKIAQILSPYIISLTGASDYAIKALSYLSAFILIMIVFLIIGKLLDSFFKAVKINLLNRLAGSVFSAAKWLIIISILLNLIVSVDKNEHLIKADIRENSLTYPYVKAITPRFIPFLVFDFDNGE